MPAYARTWYILKERGNHNGSKPAYSSLLFSLTLETHTQKKCPPVRFSSPQNFFRVVASQEHFADKDQSHVIGGLKAAISNPNTSSEAKERAAERLQELGEPEYTSSSPEPAHHELGTHQIAGYKATLTSSWNFPLYPDLVACCLSRG